MRTMLLLVSDREPLAWLLREQRFAIPAARIAHAPDKGTRLLLYTTRGCYRNPTRDRGLVMGVAHVTSTTRLLDEPVSFRGRDFGASFDLAIDGVCAPHCGVELGQLAGLLDALPDTSTWSIRLRRTLVALTDRDASLLTEKLQPYLAPVAQHLPAYLAACKV